MSNPLYIDMEYDKGYGDGYKSGYNQALEDIKEWTGILGDLLADTDWSETGGVGTPDYYAGLEDYMSRLREKLTVLRKT